jgi:chromosome partitioning protein
MGKIIAVANQKGGVGKTTTCLNLACCVGALGKKVLMCDFDPQGNASSGLGASALPGESIYDAVVSGVDIKVKSTKWCDVLPADIRLAAAEQEIAFMEDREYRLKGVLDKYRDNYDYIFIDCPPSLGMLTLNSLACADTVIVPMQCEYYALEGLSQLVNSIKNVKRKINPAIDIEGIVLTMYDGRTNLTIQVAEEIKKYFGGRVYKTVIPRNVRLSEAPSHGLPIIAYDRLSKGAEAYKSLANEFLAKNK